MENPQPPHQNAAPPAGVMADNARALLDARGVRANTAGLALLRQLHPADQAQTLMSVSERRRPYVLDALGPDGAGMVLPYLDPEDAADILRGATATALAQTLDAAPPEVAADILQHLPEPQAAEVQHAMTSQGQVLPLLQYDEETAGGLMSPEQPAVHEDITTAAALDVLRLLGPEAAGAGSVFVMDADGLLTGNLGVIPLALARPNAIVRDIMTPVVAVVTADTDQEECVRVMERYALRRLPVVDGDGRLVGVITADEAVEVAEEEATEDMFNISGMSGERLSGPLLGSVRHRLPWLALNLATTFLAATVISLFESTVARVAALAAFLPVVAGQGGIGGTQTLTLVVRSLALEGLPSGRGLRILGREVVLGLANGMLMALLVGLVGYLWQGSIVLGLILAAAMLGNMVVAGLAGAGVPLLLRRLGLDPAVSAAVFVTTFTDVLGFLFFLGLATLLLARLT